MIVYNYAQYIKTLFPTENIQVNVAVGDNNELPDRLTTIEELTSTETSFVKFSTKPIQFNCRDIDHVKAYKLAWDIFDSLANCYNFDLPAVTVEGSLFPALHVGSVNPGGKPFLLGPDAERRITFLFTVVLLYRRP